MNSDECKEKAALNAMLKLLDKKRYEAIQNCNSKIYNSMKDKFKDRTRYQLMEFLWEKRESKNSLYNILEFFPDNDPSVLGFSRQHIFESIGQILLFLNCDTKWSENKIFKTKIGVDKYLTSNDILRNGNINEGNIAGISDIYFIENGKDVIIQCKYLSKESTKSKKYDIGELFLRTNELKNKEIYIFVNNKEDLAENLKRARHRDFDTLNGIYGMTDLNSWYSNMVKRMLDYNTLDEFINNFREKKKNYIELKFHQELCSETVLKYNQEGIKDVMIGAVARSGKSYMIADLIIKRKTDLSILILGAKTETESGFQEIFKENENFSDYDIVTIDEKNSSKKKKIFMYSQEKLKNGLPDLLMRQKGSEVDIYFDEIHKGGSTDKGSAILDEIEKICNTKTFTLITATFSKPVTRYSIEKIFRWSYEDQQLMKSINEENKDLLVTSRPDKIQEDSIKELLDRYYKKFGKEYLSILRTQYSKHPDLVFLGFDYLDYRMPDDTFSDEKKIKALCESIKDEFYPKLYKDKIYDTTKLRSEMWFIPFSSNGKTEEQKGVIKPNSENLLKVLNSMNFFTDRYNFFVCHGKTKDMEEQHNVCIYKNTKKSIRKQIEEYEKKTYGEKKSLIIITGQMLRLGISLKNVVLGLNFNDIESIDPNIQTIFRVMTENENKTDGIYIDFKVNRSYSIMFEYMNYSKKKSIDSRIAETIISFNYNGSNYKSLSWTEISEFYNKIYIDFKNMSVKKIMDLKTVSDILRDNISVEELRRYSEFIPKSDIIKSKIQKIRKSSRATTPKRGKINKNDDSNQEIDILDVSDFIDSYTRLLSFFNREYECSDIEECAANAKRKFKEMKEVCQNCGEDVLGCYGKRINGYSKNIYIKSLDAYIDIINKISSIRDYVDSQFDIISGYVDTGDKSLIEVKPRKKSKTPEIFFTEETEDKTIETIDKFIEKYLPVREIEKNKFGEVMTPPELITEMLMQLPENIWSDPNLKWLDPANGIGNFPIYVYYGLMIGLEDEFPDEEERSNHIMKNMIYMIELNPKNVQASKKIFGKDANIYCGSFLPGDKGEEPGWKKAFGIEKFDIIVGNPPYNEIATGRDGKKNIDEVFLLKSFENLKQNGFVIFIMKTTCRGKMSKSYKEIIKRQIIFSKVFDFKDNPFKENIITNILLIQNKKQSKKTTFVFGDKIIKEYVDSELNIYFLPLNKKFSDRLKDDLRTYGNMENITRSADLKTKSKKYLLVSHSKDEFFISKDPKRGDNYIIREPSKKLIKFFEDNFSTLRHLGRFNGFSTPKSLFLDIPYYN